MSLISSDLGVTSGIGELPNRLKEWKLGYSANSAVILTLAVLLLAPVAIMQGFGNLILQERNGGPLHQQGREYHIGFDLAEAQLSDITSNIDKRDVTIATISSRYDPELGAFHIFGELVNDLDTPVKNVGLNATVYDAKGNNIGNASGQAYVDYLRPQEKSAFDVALYGNRASTAQNFSYYKISKSWDSVQEPKPSLLELDLRDMVIDTCGFYHFIGTVGNYGNEPTNHIILSAAFYNERNQVIKSAQIPIIDYDESLESIKYAPFTLLIDGQELSEFAYYSFNIQSAEYASRIFNEKDNPDNSFDYENRSPTTLFPPSFSSGASPTMELMTVSTNSETYSVGSNDIRVVGKIPIANEEEWENQHRDSLALIKLMHPSGLVLDKATSPISRDGSYSASFSFRVAEGSEGQVFRVRTEYKGNAVENNFSIGFGNAYNNHTNSGGSVDVMEQVCSPVGVAIDQLNWNPIDANNTDGIGGNNNNNNSTGDHSTDGVITAGSSVILSVVAKNRMTHLQPLSTVIEVFDASGRAVFLNLDNVLLDPYTEQKTSTAWTPEGSGEYRIKSFVITGLDEPRIISRSLNMVVKVL